MYVVAKAGQVEQFCQLVVKPPKKINLAKLKLIYNTMNLSELGSKYMLLFFKLPLTTFVKIDCIRQMVKY